MTTHPNSLTIATQLNLAKQLCAEKKHSGALKLLQQINFGFPTEVVKRFEAALSLAKDEEIYRFLSDSYRKEHQYKQAIAYTETAMRIKPNQYLAYVLRIWAYRDSNMNPLHIVADATKILALEPSHSMAFLYRANAHFALRNYAAALQDAQTYLKKVSTIINPGNTQQARTIEATALQNKIKIIQAKIAEGMAFRNKTKPEHLQAIVSFKAVLALVEDEKIYRFLSDSCRLAGQYKDAITYAEKAMRLPKEKSKEHLPYVLRAACFKITYKR